MIIRLLEMLMCGIGFGLGASLAFTLFRFATGGSKDATLEELRRRNDIGERQTKYLESISMSLCDIAVNTIEMIPHDLDDSDDDTDWVGA